jgi:hypothetical protein
MRRSFFKKVAKDIASVSIKQARVKQFYAFSAHFIRPANTADIKMISVMARAMGSLNRNRQTAVRGKKGIPAKKPHKNPNTWAQTSVFSP